MSGARAGFAWVASVLLAGGAVAADPTPSERLADQFSRDVNVIMERHPLTVAGLETALILSEQAVLLTKEDPELWRQRLKLATLAERPDVMRASVARLVELDPEDQVARLTRIKLAIDDVQTGDERVEAFLRWLAPENRAALGGPVASRLALDLALLYRRMGDQDAFGRWLTDSVTLDPGHRAAAALAAGYFQSRVDDAYGQAELLVNLLLTDPASMITEVQLGHLLLEHGAYAGAERLLTIATHPSQIKQLRATLRPGAQVAVKATIAQIFADLAVAQWANGNAEAALRTIVERQRSADAEMRLAARQLLRLVESEARTRQQARAILTLAFGLSADEVTTLIPEAGEPDPSALYRAGLNARLDPTLATVKAAILDRLDDEDAASALRTALSSYQMLILRAMSAENPDAAEIARLKLQQSLVMFWLGGDIGIVERLVREADEATPLSVAAKERFAGLVALRRGSSSEAIDRLSPLGPDDHIARLGLAMAHLQLDERREAALNLLAVARHEPGSLVSIWAAERLFEVLGQRVPINDEARRLEQLIQSVPVRLDRCLDDPTLCVGIRITPAEPSYDAFEPLRVNVEIVNNWRYPLSVDPDGPIEPNIVLEISARIARASEAGFLDPIVLDIDRRLTLAPRERIVIPFDLRRHRLGLLLDSVAVQGAIMRVGGIVNFSALSVAGASPVLEPGTLGSETKSVPFRVDGVRFERQWIEEAMADVIRDDGPTDMRILAFLSKIAGAGMAARLSTQDQQLFADAMTALTDAFTRLDPVEQAWVLSVIEPSSTEPILAVARTSDELLVKLAYMTYCLDGQDDPMLEAGMSDADPRIRRLAQFATELFESEASRADAAQ